MISPEDQKRVVAIVQRDWQDIVLTDEFQTISTGREQGHRIADPVEERTLDILEREKFDVAYEHGKTGSRRARSMGDVWLRSGDPLVFNPINVKASIAATGGQPNMVSLGKLTDALVKHQIDSYWLLLVRLGIVEGQFSPSVRLINILDYLDYLHFDSGPGQLMLKNDSFYAYVEGGGEGTRLSTEEVIDRLADLRREGDQRLLNNRAQKLARLETALSAFDPTSPMDQAALDLRPSE